MGKGDFVAKYKEMNALSPLCAFRDWGCPGFPPLLAINYIFLKGTTIEVLISEQVPRTSDYIFLLIST